MQRATTFEERILFLAKYFRHPLLNASLAPSSGAAASAMLDGIDFARIRTIVELGAGTGPYTAELVRRAAPNATIILVELDADYARILKEKFGARVIVENVGAERLDEVLHRHGIERPDLIVSSLPFLPPAPRKELFASIRRCTEKGTIFRFEIILLPWGLKVYAPLPVRRKGFVLKNFPPLWIYGIN